ncbi:helix-turn-helix domain-containing protein [Paenibacillus hodogayensis]|uniref:Helix-turn-helix domain-containing protein n=1 Tax=Paenibacillus hodogayensis TaxID=279208 RepID=A0ABV5VQG8_9BACL
MYTLLIVDGNPNSRERVAGLLNWRALGFQVTGSFSDGLEALQEAERSRPDIVLADMRLTAMGGWELGRRIRERHPGVKLVLMGERNAFEESRSDIGLETEQCVWTPFGEEELREAVMAAADGLARERQAAEREEALRREMKRSLPLHRERLLRELFLGFWDGLPAERLRSRLAFCDMNLPAAGRYRVLLLQSDDGGSAGETSLPDSARLARALEERFAARGNLGWPQPVPMTDSGVAMLAGGEAEDPDTELLLQLIGEAAELVGEPLRSGLSVGISRPGPLSGVAGLYAETVRSLEAGSCGDGTRVVAADEQLGECDDRCRELAGSAERMVRDMRGLVFSDKTPDTEALLKRYLGTSEAVLPDSEAKPFMLLLSSALQRVYVECGKSVNGHILLFLSLWNKLDTATGPVQSRTVIDPLIALARRQLFDEHRAVCEQAVKDMKRFIMKRFMEPITVRRIADEAKMSVNHANAVFQYKTGRKLLDYLTEYRMEKAKSLLRGTDLDMAAIAEQTGFGGGAARFGLAFQAYAGLTPEAYREAVEQSER